MKMRLLCLAPALLMAAVSVLPAADARAQSREEIQQRNQALEQQYQQDQQSSSSLGAPSPYGQPSAAYPSAAYPADVDPRPGATGGNLTSQLLQRVQSLEDQVRNLRGRVDDLTNQLQRQSADLGKQVSDLNFKLGQGGAPSGSSPGAGSLAAPGEAPAAPSATAAPRPAPSRRTPERALQEGNAAVARRDYATAEASAREVIAGGASPRATDAQFLLAQSEAGQKRYQQAAADYYDAYNRSPRSGRAPVALLGVANALLALNDRHDACQALAKINAEFPTAAAPVRQAVAGARSRAGGCR